MKIFFTADKYGLRQKKMDADKGTCIIVSGIGITRGDTGHTASRKAGQLQPDMRLYPISG